MVAIQFLTRLPTPRLAVSGKEFAASIRWFPAVGLMIGAAVAAGAWGAMKIDPWIGAATALVLWVMITGALHIDGLADIADASGAGHKDREKLLAVLADPHIGSFGVVAIALQLLAKLILLHSLASQEALAGVILAPFAARIGSLIWARWLPPLHDGLGARFRNSVRLMDIMLWTALLAVSAWAAPALLAAPVLILLWGWWIRRKLGGISGDGHGAGIELVETGLLFAFAMWNRIA